MQSFFTLKLDKFDIRYWICLKLINRGTERGIMKLIHRDATTLIEQAAQFFPVLALLGPRQSGKTTLARSLFSQYAYVTLEDPDMRAYALQDPRGFLTKQRNEHGLIIDEFQYAPALTSYIQTIVDLEQKPALFVLTGSQNYLMNQTITQSLAGRVSIHTLLPLSIHELQQADLLPKEAETILYKGCYPAIYAKDVPPRLLYSNYLQTYLERDVRQLTQVGNLDLFTTFIRMCATRNGQQLNLSALGNDCGVSDVTAQRWLSILKASYIVFELQPYYANIGKILVKTPKLYFYDPGLVSYLLGISEEAMHLSPYRGALFESFIIAELYKYKFNYGSATNLYYLRDKTGNEIDCMVVRGDNIVPVEIKASRTMMQRFYAPLEYWQEVNEIDERAGYVIMASNADQPLAADALSWQKLEAIYKLLR